MHPRSRPARRRALYALVAATAFGLAACGGGDTGGSGDEQAGEQDAGEQDAAAPATTAAPTTTTVACTSDLSLERIDLTVDGLPREAFVRLPPQWDGTTPAPLVLSFHGASSSAEQQMTISGGGLVDKAAAEGYVAVFPNGRPDGLRFTSGWSVDGAIDEPAFVTALLDELDARLCIDESRVYAAGISNGGAMTVHTVCALSDRITAAAAVVPQLPDVPCEQDRPVPMMAFAGVEDALLPYDGGGISGQQPFEEWGAAVAQRNGCDPGMTEHAYAATVEELTWSGCDAPVRLFRVHGNGHTWPGHAFTGVPREVLVAALRGEGGGAPNPVMEVLGLTPEQMADNITLVNTDVDATAVMFDFFEAHAPAAEPGADAG